MIDNTEQQNNNDKIVDRRRIIEGWCWVGYISGAGKREAGIMHKINNWWLSCCEESNDFDSIRKEGHLINWL